MRLREDIDACVLVFCKMVDRSMKLEVYLQETTNWKENRSREFATSLVYQIHSTSRLADHPDIIGRMEREIAEAKPLTFLSGQFAFVASWRSNSI